MGILLPPVSQVTNTRINLTQHHRNRSLDSALQRIPEVSIKDLNYKKFNIKLHCAFCIVFSYFLYIFLYRKMRQECVCVKFIFFFKQVNKFYLLVFLLRSKFHLQMQKLKTHFAQTPFWDRQCVPK